LPTPSISFEGGNNNDNFNYNFSQVLPPDTEGAVGPNDYVQVINQIITVFDKTTGAVRVKESLPGLWLNTLSICSNVTLGDPIVMYDHISDRWVMEEIAASSVDFFTGAPVGPFFECLAASQTSDPTGSYYLSAFEMNPVNLPGGGTDQTPLNDYPKLVAWPDAYYLSTNLYGGNGFNTFEGVRVFAIDRNQLLAGQSAEILYMDLPPKSDFTPNPGIFSMLPSSYDGALPPAGEPNHYIGVVTPGETGSPALRVFDFHVDFTTPSNSTFTEHAGSPIAVNSFNSTICSDVNGNCVPQPGGNPNLEVLSDRLMWRLQYRNFGSYEALVTNHTVLGPSGHAAVRYYDLRNSSLGGPFSVYDQATYAPDADSRWMGSAAMDHDGNLVVGYSVSSTSVNPSIRYAGRLSSQTGGLLLGENTLIAGGGAQTDSNPRWGDYSALMIDPSDDCMFWYTNEYYAGTSDAGWQTRIGSFKFPNCP
jgi:hypothetical protein